MDYIKLYSSIIKKNMGKPYLTRRLINLGLNIGYKYVSYFPDKRFPKSLRFLNKICFKNIILPLKYPQNAAWVNIFAPTEILLAMDIHPLFVEGFSSFMSGLFIEDALIDITEYQGISNTLCSYHKTFLGAIIHDIVPKPRFLITTSMICDANISTFRYISKLKNVPLYIIDIPNEYSPEAIDYVKKQIIEMIEFVEDNTHKKLNIEILKEVIRRENKTRKLMNNYINSLAQKCLPTTMTFEMYMLFATHVFVGAEETLLFYEMLLDDIKKSPYRSKKGIFFVHLLPIFEDNFKYYLNLDGEFDLLGCDLNYDFLDTMDEQNPIDAIAKKLVLNIYNGSFERKIEHIVNLIQRIKPDGVVQFCHLGCKQSIGGAILLKERLNELNFPFTTIDGDALDKRNNQAGQIKTRLEAFFEILRSR